MSREKAIELLRKAKRMLVGEYDGLYGLNVKPFINQALAELKQPKCEESGKLIALVNKGLGLVYDTMHPMPKAAISQILSRIKTELEQPKCETCGGSGWVLKKIPINERPIKCGKCDGWGWLLADGREYQESCPECNRKPCPACQQPEPTEFTEKFRQHIDGVRNVMKGKTGTYCRESCNIIDRQAARIEELKAENERPKPQPLLFDTIGGFKVIISNEVPENEIWFATHEQLQMALEYSAHQVEQALKGE